MGRSRFRVLVVLVVGAGIGVGSSAFATSGIGAHAPIVDFLDEGFEEGVFPPADWALLDTEPPPHTWHLASGPPYVRSGTGAARILWQDERVQNEALITAPVDVTGAAPEGLSLSFWWYTDPFWFGGANTVFRVHASLDGTTWDLLWDVTDVPEAGWLWRNTQVDLSAYAGQPGELRVRFRYKGTNAADMSLDDVRIGYIAPARPPENDDCSGALANGFVIGPVSGTYVVAGNNTLAQPDYPLDAATSCTSASHEGNDLVWVIDVPAHHVFAATMTTAGHWDDTLFLVRDCLDPIGTCVAGDRAVPDGSTLSVLNGDDQIRRYYLVASAFSQGKGEFTVTATIEKETAVRPESFGSVKARYR